MKTFIRNLCVSNKDTLQDVIKDCNKILNWLTPHYHSTLSYDDVETLLKASIYMEECITMFGGKNLMQALIDNEPDLEEFYKGKLNILEEKKFLSHTISLILNTNKGEDYLPAIEELMRQIYDKEYIENIIKEAIKNEKRISSSSSSSSQRDRLLLAVQYLFQLPESQLELGMKRLLGNLHFQVLGYVFLERESSDYFARCSIVMDHICQCLTDFTIPSYFLDTLQQTVGFSDEGRYFYWQCLGNMIFARYFRDFCIKYFESFKEEEEEENGEGETVGEGVHQFNMQNISYLFCMALNMQSPCRLAFQRALNTSHIIPYYLNIIQKNIYIYGV